MSLLFNPELKERILHQSEDSVSCTKAPWLSFQKANCEPKESISEQFSSKNEVRNKPVEAIKNQKKASQAPTSFFCRPKACVGLAADKVELESCAGYAKL